VNAQGNPFSARRLRPGAVPFFFPPGLDAAALVERLRAAGWRGQVVGPHGSGKSTLLAALRLQLEAAGLDVHAAALHDGQSLPAGFWAALGKGRPGVVLLDGHEQLGVWARWRLRWACRRRGLGLVVTSHTDAGLPVLYRTEVTPEVARRVVAYLTAGTTATVADREVDDRLAVRGGNLREALFDLYDLHERRRDCGVV
jgi:hypothetical protein